MKWLILLALATVCVVSVDDGDWVDPFYLPLPFIVKPFYAGYLDIHSGKALYYVYTPSENNPSKDPLIVLISPGPGCSSLHDWLYSSGQFTFTRGTSNFRNNPDNWHKEANVLYIEGPAGVGFSYGPEQAMGDNSTVTQYYRAILKFYEKFPELKDQKMYLSGFGYAGIIAPKLALAIIQHNKSPNTPAWLILNLNGMLLFNPCTVHEQCDRDFMFNHYTVKALRNNFFIDKPTYEEYYSQCAMRTPGCDAIEEKIASDFRISGADLANMYTQCLNQPGDYGCIDHVGIDTFLNVKAVQQDLNAQKNIIWNLCNITIFKNYERDPSGSLYTYETLLKEQHNLKIWIISGSQSAFIPTYSTKRWVEQVRNNLGLPSIRLWEPWFYQNINAGEIQEMPGLSLVTIRAAGLDMFINQPEIAWHVYDSFLKGTRL